jgi:hypothetical protein
MSKENSVDAVTVGKAAVTLQEKAINETKAHSVIDQTEVQLSEYTDHLIQCVKDNRSKIIGDFYVVVLTKMERLLTNVMRNYFFARMTCPTPDYDQAVFKYDAAREELSFLWIVPDRETCITFKENALSIAPEERDLLKFVLDFSSGELFKLAKRLNGEKLESVELEH